MLSPTSSRSVDPRLAAASGVMRDTVGAIHNLQHLLGSVKVGPKALSRIVPDVRGSCAPMIAATHELVAATLSGPLAGTSAAELGALVEARVNELENALSHVGASTFRASDRLFLESALAPVVRDLDGALDLVELLVEASATGRVMVALSDVIRESANRPDTSSGRGRRVRLTFSADPRLSVRVNPRLALRLLSFAVAFVAGRDGVHATAAVAGDLCTLRIAPPCGGGDAVVVAAPSLIPLSRKCASEIAASASCTLETREAEHVALLSMPLDPGE